MREIKTLKKERILRLMRRKIKMNDNFPKDLKYNKDYSWVKVNGDIATLGIIAPIAEKVKEFVFIMLPEKGKKIKRGEKYVSLEAVKWTGDLSSPLSGEILEVNNPLFDEPSKINNDGYKNWIAKVKFDGKKELDELMNSEEAIKFYSAKLN
jgi:glycine cleavage system H protein